MHGNRQVGAYFQDQLQNLCERGSDAGSRLSQMVENAGDTLQRQLQPMGRTVRDYPISSVLAAVGLGAILGALFLRR